MKRIWTFIALLVLTTWLSLGASAVSKSTTVEIAQTTQVGGTTLKPGQYTVEVKNADHMAVGQNAEIVIKRYGQKVEVTGQVKALSQVPHRTQLIIDSSGSIPTLSEIDFGGSTMGVSLMSEPMQTGQ